MALVLVHGCGGSDSPTETQPQSNWSPVADMVIGTGGAILTGDDFTLEVPAGAFSEEATLQISSQPSDEYTLLDSRLMPGDTVFRFSGLPDFVEPLTLELSFDASKATDDILPMVYFEEEMRRSEGGGYVPAGRPLFGTEVDWENGVITATIPPSALADEKVRGDKNGPLEFIASVVWNGGVQWTTVENEFQISWNTGDVDQAWIDGLITDLTVSRMMLEALGYEYCGLLTNYVDVHVRTIEGSDGNFFQSGFGISQCYLEIDPAKEGIERRAAAGHELFHLYQVCYGVCGHARAYNHEWLSEAVSVWFEPLLIGDSTYIPTVMNGNRDFITKGLETNTAAIGYGASTFMIWLTDKYGDLNVPLEIFQKVALDPSSECASSKGVDAALVDRGSNLTAEFREFSREFLLGTTGHDWNYTDPTNCILTLSNPNNSYGVTLPDLSAQSFVTALNTDGAPVPSGDLTVQMQNNTPANVEAFVYSGPANNGPWTLAGTAHEGDEVIVAGFGTGDFRKVKTVLVNSRTPVNSTDGSDASISFAFAETPDAFPADLFKMELQTELTMASGPGSTGNRLFELRFDIVPDGNTFTAVWDTTYENSNRSVGQFTCTVNAAHDALESWSWSQDNHSPSSGIHFHKAASGTGPVPLELLNDTTMKFSSGEGTGTCDIISSVEYWYKNEGETELLDEMVSYDCIHNSYFTVWLWNTD